MTQISVKPELRYHRLHLNLVVRWTTHTVFGALNTGWCAASPCLRSQGRVHFPQGALSVSALGNAPRVPCLKAAAWGGQRDAYSLLRSFGSPDQVTTRSTWEAVLRGSRTLLSHSVSVQRSKTLSSILLRAAFTSSWHLHPPLWWATNQARYHSSCSHGPGAAACQLGSSLHAACTNTCVRPFSLSFRALVTASTAYIKMLVPCFTAVKREKLFLKATVPRLIDFLFFPRRDRRGGRVQPCHVEQVLFLPVAMVTEPPGWAASKRCTKPSPDTQHWGHRVIGWKEGGERGSTLMSGRHGRCLQLVNCHKEAIDNTQT